MPGTSEQRPPVEYRDAAGRLWHASEVAPVNVVEPSIDGPNHFLVIRFEREGEERFTRWRGAEDWRDVRTLNRMFELATRPMSDTGEEETGVGPAPPESVRLWCDLVKSMGPDELESFERRTFAQWDRASLGDLRAAIQQRWRRLAG